MNSQPCLIDTGHLKAYIDQKKNKKKTKFWIREGVPLNNILISGSAAPNHPSFSGYATTSNITEANKTNEILGHGGVPLNNILIIGRTALNHPSFSGYATTGNITEANKQNEKVICTNIKTCREYVLSFSSLFLYY